MLSVTDARLLLDKDENDLWALLGTAIDPTFHITPEPIDKLILAGRRWFSDHYQQLQEKLCPHPIVKRLIDDKTSDEVSIVVTICGLVSASMNPLIAAGVSVLIVKRGLHHLCDGCEFI